MPRPGMELTTVVSLPCNLFTASWLHYCSRASVPRPWSQSFPSHSVITVRVYDKSIQVPGTTAQLPTCR